MKIDAIIRDPVKTLQQIIRALSNGLRPEDNFAGGGKAGQVLTSTGPNTPPEWKDLP